MINQIGIQAIVGDSQYDSHVERVKTYSGLLPSINTATIYFPQSLSLSVATGDEASLILTSLEEKTPVLTGLVRLVKNELNGSSVVVGDSSVSLSTYRPATTFDAQSTGDIIKTLCADRSVKTGSIDPTTTLPLYVADQNQNAAEHIAYISELAGCAAFVSTENKLEVKKYPESSPEIGLRYGRELLSCRTSERSMDTSLPFTIGNGPAGSADAPDALRHSVESLPSDAPEPGIGAVWKTIPVLRTPGDAKSASENKQAIWKKAHKTIDCVCILSPHIMVGQVIELADQPDSVNKGSWVVTEVIHEVLNDGYASTTIHGIATEASDLLLLGLLGGRF